MNNIDCNIACGTLAPGTTSRLWTSPCQNVTLSGTRRFPFATHKNISRATTRRAIVARNCSNSPGSTCFAPFQASLTSYGKSYSGDRSQFAHLRHELTNSLLPWVYASRSSINCSANAVFNSAYTFASLGWFRK